MYKVILNKSNKLKIKNITNEDKINFQNKKIDENVMIILKENNIIYIKEYEIKNFIKSYHQLFNLSNKKERSKEELNILNKLIEKWKDKEKIINKILILETYEIMNSYNEEYKKILCEIYMKNHVKDYYGKKI